MKLTELASMAANHVEEGCMLPKSRYRVQQLDADAACYAIADYSISTDANTSRMFHYINGLRARADCEHTYVHTTQHMKGGRTEVANFQEYQKDRNHGNPEYMQRVRELRKELDLFKSSRMTPAPQYYLEADDSMTIFQEKVIRDTGDVFASVISTNDKDLNSSFGVVQNINTGRFTTQGTWDGSKWHDIYGKTVYDVDSKKLVGRGTSFFWHQMLAGDPVDHIKGLPLVMPEVANIVKPVKNMAGRKPKAIAYGSCVDYLRGINSDAAAARRVLMMYRAYSSRYGTPELFEETAILLWMQRNPTPYDVYRYMRDECGLDITPSAVIVERINEYAARVAEYGRK